MVSFHRLLWHLPAAPIRTFLPHQPAPTLSHQLLPPPSLIAVGVLAFHPSFLPPSHPALPAHLPLIFCSVAFRPFIAVAARRLHRTALVFHPSATYHPSAIMPPKRHKPCNYNHVPALNLSWDTCLYTRKKPCKWIEGKNRCEYCSHTNRLHFPCIFQISVVGQRSKTCVPAPQSNSSPRRRDLPRQIDPLEKLLHPTHPMPHALICAQAKRILPKSCSRKETHPRNPRVRPLFQAN
jgi:hypothetical protein